MVGNLADASLALSDYYGAGKYLYSREGCTREVYLINGVIYKIEYTRRDNETEYLNGQRWAGRLPKGVVIPEMTLYSVGDQNILAMEYIDGIPTGDCYDSIVGTECLCEEGTCLPPELSDDLLALGWHDQSYGNAINRNGIYYLVDIAC